MDQKEIDSLEIGTKYIFDGKFTEKFIITKVSETFIDSINLDNKHHYYTDKDILLHNGFKIISNATGSNKMLY